MNFFIDCTVGVGIVWAAHECICRTGTHFFGDDCALAHIGEYGEAPHDIWVWAKQLAAYLFALFLNKLVVSIVLYAFLEQMGWLGDWIFSPLQAHPEAELIVVMVLCPWLLTSLQVTMSLFFAGVSINCFNIYLLSNIRSS